jgi:acyl-lipid omega-6 desaturase (Delta-12 desaturase)
MRNPRHMANASLCPDAGNLAPEVIVEITARLKTFAVPERKRSIVQLCVTAGFFALTWAAMWLSMAWSYAAALVFGIVCAGFLVRLFMIQHDCAHGSFFGSRRANDVTGRIIGLLTMTPYGYWKGAHAQHHAAAGNLDKRGVGDVTTLTVEEYLRLSWWKRLAYRLYRHPIVLFGLGPLYLFLIKHRLPFDLPFRQRKMWLSVLGTNAALAIVLGGLAMLIGPVALLKLQLPIMLMASSAGVWLFFIQHQFEGVYWRRQREWRYDEAALYGSSYYALPGALRWLTASIGLHHIHHLCSRIPNYRLQDAMEQVPGLRRIQPVGFLQSLRYTALSLWDEADQKLIRFCDLKQKR